MFKVALVHIDEPNPLIPDWVRHQLERQHVDLSFQQCSVSLEVSALAADADVVWVFGGSELITPETLADLKRCRAIIRTGSGTDNIPVDEATERGILVVNTPQATMDPVSDHVIGLMLSVLRWIPRQDRVMRQGGWRSDHLVWNGHLSGSTVGLVGLGHIARRTVQKLSGFDLEFMAYDPHVSASDMTELRVVKSELDDVLRKSDIVSLHTPLTDETYHLIGERELQLMKPKSILINTARGPVVDEQALVRALTEGRIAAAALDVFETKPLTLDSRLRQLENVVLTPHVASESDQVSEDFWRYSVEAVTDMAQGFLPASFVNPQVVDRCGFTSRDS